MKKKNDWAEERRLVMGEIIANCYTIHRYIHDCLPLGVVVLIVVIRVVDF